MIFGKTKMEFKVGIFVFVGLAILVIFVLSIGNFRTWTSRYTANFIFQFVNGVKSGAPVRFAGVNVGEVSDLNFIPSPDGEPLKVKVSCWVRNDVKIPADSTVWVNTLGLLGEKYIEIMPGENYSEILQPDGEIAGKDPIPMHDISEKALKIIGDIDESIVKIKNKEGTIGKLLYDDAIYNDLQAFLESLKDDLKLLLQETEGMVADIRKNPWKLFFRPKDK